MLMLSLLAILLIICKVSFHFSFSHSGSLPGSPGVQIISGYPAFPSGHPPLSLSPASSSAARALVTSTSSSCRPSSNSAGPNLYPVPNHVVGALPSHPPPIPNHIGQSTLGVSPSLAVPPSSIIYQLPSISTTHPSAVAPLAPAPIGYLAPNHAFAAGSLQSPSSSTSSSSSASLLRPHVSGGVTQQFSPSTVLPLNQTPFLNQPVRG